MFWYNIHHKISALINSVSNILLAKILLNFHISTWDSILQLTTYLLKSNYTLVCKLKLFVTFMYLFINALQCKCWSSEAHIIMTGKSTHSECSLQLSIKWFSYYASLSVTTFRNEKLFKILVCNESSQYRNTVDFALTKLGKPSRASAITINTFHCQQK